MKIENQVCTLEQAKRLKELGIKYDSFIAYVLVCPDPLGESSYTGLMTKEHQWADKCEVIADMFTCAELGEMLLVEDDKVFNFTHYNEHYGSWATVVQKRVDDNEADFEGQDIKIVYESECDTEAEAKADALIWMLENNLTTTEQVNQRLED